MNERNVRIKKGYLSRRIKDKEVLGIQDISDRNFMGMSNTAVKSSLLESLVINEDVIAVDWFIFSVLLKKGCKAVFTSETETYYRQHGGNTIGLDSMDERKLKNAIKAKRLHFREMAKNHFEYKRPYEQMKALEKRFQ